MLPSAVNEWLTLCPKEIEGGAKQLVRFYCRFPRLIVGLQIIASGLQAGAPNSLEILACHEAGVTVALPKPKTSGAKSEDFVYLPEEDAAYRCPASE
jgi:hypothetical protein